MRWYELQNRIDEAERNAKRASSPSAGPSLPSPSSTTGYTTIGNIPVGSPANGRIDINSATLKVGWYDEPTGGVLTDEEIERIARHVVELLDERVPDSQRVRELQEMVEELKSA